MNESSEQLPETLTFHYKKCSTYRSIYLDGALGGVTARRMIVANIYSERPPIPKQTSRRIVSQTGNEIELDKEESIDESIEGIVRNLEASLYMTPVTAKQFGQWLINKADEILEYQAAEEKSE